MKSRSGFTLIELMVVVIVISIIASIVVLAYDNQMKSARDQSARQNLLVLSKGMDSYYSETGSHPLACGAKMIGCAVEHYTERGVTPSAVISPSTTSKQLHDILPEVDDDFGHPRLDSDTTINQTTRIGSIAADAINPDSYYLYAPDSYAVTPGTNGYIHARAYFLNPDNSTLLCRFSQRGYDIHGVNARRPYPYILGFYSEVEQSWKFYKSQSRTSQNVLEWNTYSEPSCEAQDIGALKS